VIGMIHSPDAGQSQSPASPLLDPRMSVPVLSDSSQPIANENLPLEWVTSGKADEWLDLLMPGPLDSFAAIKLLRKRGLSPDQAAAVVQQITLREIGKRKFSNAANMFFERTLLEQATDERLAEYKAARFSRCPALVDICCGLGGDLISLARQAKAMGIDSSPHAICLAKANCQANAVDVQFCCGVAESSSLPSDAWVHIDPDRRIDGNRTTSLQYFSPNSEFLDQLIRQQKNVAIKLAPVTRVHETWANGCREWLGDRRECKQQMVWFGDLCPCGTNAGPGTKRAVAIDREGEVLFQWTESKPGRSMVANKIDSYIYEPHSTLIAGRMIDSLANHFGLSRLADDIQYLTGPEVVCPAASAFRVLEICRIDQREIAARLASLQAGQLEIKKRGVDHRLMERFGQLKLKGDVALTLILSRLREQHVAVICQRVDGDSFQ